MGVIERATVPIARGVVPVMACGTGAIIANLYYAQPLEDTLARQLGSSTAAIGMILTVTQIGYAVGLVALVPLGDLLERRALLATMLSVGVVGLLGMAVAPSVAILGVAAAVVGVTAVAAQIIVPFAAHLAPPDQQGRVTSSVMSGLLIGILLSRTVAGVVAWLVGWRFVFVLGAVATGAVAVALWRILPTVAPTTNLPYPQLLRSVAGLVREEPVLRLRMAYGAATFAAFCGFWSSAGFLLARPPYEWSQLRIGLFALIGVIGALLARVTGRLTDRGIGGPATGVFLLLTAGSFLLLAKGATEVVALAIGVVCVDIGSQGTHICNQHFIFRLRSDARSRLNTAYMTAYFLAGAVGSFLSSVVVYPRFGWSGVCLLAGAFPLAGFVLWAIESGRRLASAP